MKFVVIFGPQSVGKMTVGQQLAKITGLKLFHNHMTIELVSNFFSYGSPQGKRLVTLFRQEIFEEVSKSDLDGLIFTYVWPFDHPSHSEYIYGIADLFRARGGEIYFVELEASLDIRLERNTTPNRLAHKPTKRDLEWSERDVREGAVKYRMNSNPGEISEKNYLRIDDTHISAEDTARFIKDAFKL